MQTFKKLLIFFLCNIIGFSLFPLLYVLSLSSGLIDINAEEFDASGFFMATNVPGTKTTPIPIMLSFPSMTWAICALFSFSSFFVSKRWKIFFLLAPLLMPFLHSLYIMLKFI